MDDKKVGIALIILILILIVMSAKAGFDNGKTSAFARKCAETQGKYDFCAQKISYEVKQ